MKNSKKNFAKEGNLDIIAKKVSKAVMDEESERYNTLMDKIEELCDEAGFYILDAIVLKDSKTGRVWR